jgi:collagenase-like PrtC family protease
MKYLELLSPARDADTGIAAINCGADAVYIAASKFGARKEAGNDIKDIERLISFAHLFRSKVYLALNTILKDDEIDEALKIIDQVWNAGIDGLIIQDFGLLTCSLPPIPLIASTQTDNRSVEKVKFLEKCGFSRVILARELTLNEIAQIRRETSIELESFVHGALCVSYSGQCWASVSVTGRSANRGECAQICRSAYDLEDAEGTEILKNKHLLSLKDLNLSAHLRQMIDAGICSFKIEGRLKDMSYVKNITSYYRKRIDSILESDRELKRPSSGTNYLSFDPDPEKTFNRGYTSHFVNGRQPDLSSFHTQKSIGKQVGRVTGSKEDRLIVDLTEEIHNGDGICYFDKTGLLCGFLVNKAEKNSLLPNIAVDIETGTSLYRNLDIHFQKELVNKSVDRRISVKAIFEECQQGFSFKVEDEDHYSAEKTIELVKEPAKNAGLAENSVKQQLRKAGETPFQIDEIQIRWVAPCFISISALNGLRRETLDLLLKARKDGYRRIEKERKEVDAIFPDSSIGYKGNVINRKAEEFYLKHGTATIEPGFESVKPEGNPSLMITRYCIKFELGICPRQHGQNKFPAFKEPLYLRDSNRRYRLEFDCKSCEMKLFLAEKEGR